MAKKNNKIISFDDVNRINEDLNNSENHQLTFENYPALCDYLNIPVVTGNQKITQLKKLNTTLDLQKNDDSFIIKKAIFPIADYDKSNLKELTEYTILSYILYQHQEGRSHCTVSISYLAEMLGYITLKYKHFYAHPKQLSQQTSIDEKTVYEFFEKTSDLYNRYIVNSLETLEKYNYLFFTKKYYAVENIILDTGKQQKVKTKFGDEEIHFVPNVTKKCRELSDEEISKVLKIEDDAFFETIDYDRKFKNLSPDELKQSKIAFLDSLKASNVSMLSYLFSHRLEKKFFSIRSRKLMEQMNISSAYKTYDIVYVYDKIYNGFQFTYQKILKEHNINASNILNKKNIFFNASSELIETSSDKLLDNTKKRHEREKQKIEQDPLIPLSQKEKTKALIDRETKEFKQLLDLLIYQQKNMDENFKSISKNNYVSSDEFDNIFSDNLIDIKNKNDKFKKRNKNLYT